MFLMLGTVPSKILAKVSTYEKMLTAILLIKEKNLNNLTVHQWEDGLIHFYTSIQPFKNLGYIHMY